jgi:hypothetical protein
VDDGARAATTGTGRGSWPHRRSASGCSPRSSLAGPLVVELAWAAAPAAGGLADAGGPRATAPEAGVAPGSSPAPAVPRTAYSPGVIAAGAACIASRDLNEKEEELGKRKGEQELRW